MVDYFMKLGHFIYLKVILKNLSYLASIFMKKIWKHHGLLRNTLYNYKYIQVLVKAMQVS
jgi:hypothetical protein